MAQQGTHRSKPTSKGGIREWYLVKYLSRSYRGDSYRHGLLKLT